MHGNEQIINELLGKYVHRLNKSTRQQFLVNVAARRCDDDGDSNSEGSSVVDEVGGMDSIELSSSEEQVTAAPRPPRYAVLAPSASSPEYFKSSSVNQRRSSLSGEQISKTVLASVPVKKQTPTIAPISRVYSSPILRRAEALNRKTTEIENLEARQHERGSRVVLHPNRPTLDHKLSRSISLRSSSFTEVDDDISIAASVMSTASIQSALYSEDKPNLVVYTHSKSKSEHQPRLPMRGSYVHTSYNKSLRSKKFDMDDTSTVTTEAISMFSGISLSRSTSFESAASYEVLQVDKSRSKESIRSYDASLSKDSRRSELNRLKKLTLMCPSTNSDSKSWNPEKKIEDSQIESINNINCRAFVVDNEEMQVMPTRKTLKDLKSKRYSLGRANAPQGNNTMKVAIGHTDSTASVESETASTRSKLEDGNRPMTAIAKRALLRRRSTSRAQSATRTTCISTPEDSGKYTHAPSEKVNKVRPHSMSPMRMTLPQVGLPIVDDKDINNRSSNYGFARTSEEQTKEAVPPMPGPLESIETNCSTAISSRAERRRSRSVSRSRASPSSSSKRESPALRTASTSAINSDSLMGTPPRCAPKRLVTMTPTPPKMMPMSATSDEIASSSNSSTPMRTSLMRSALNKRFC